MEIWKDIVDFNGDYQISNIGNVKSLKFNRIKYLKIFEDKHGYLNVRLSVNGNGITIQNKKLI